MDDVLKKHGGEPVAHGRRKDATKPEWANGLKRFYDSVVDEPLPDDLAALLSKLDDNNNGSAA